jgi:hypothetical protein
MSFRDIVAGRDPAIASAWRRTDLKNRRSGSIDFVEEDSDATWCATASSVLAA